MSFNQLMITKLSWKVTGWHSLVMQTIWSNFWSTFTLLSMSVLYPFWICDILICFLKYFYFDLITNRLCENKSDLKKWIVLHMWMSTIVPIYTKSMLWFLSLYHTLKDRLVTIELRLDDKDTCTNAITAYTPQSSWRSIVAFQIAVCKIIN